MTSRSSSTAIALSLLIGGVVAQPALSQSQACFLGQDQFGAPVQMVLQAERYGELFEVYGQLHSINIGTMRIKADGWSGAGRMFRSHEYESGAVFVRISDYTGSGLVLNVDGYGSFHFQTVAC